VDETIVSSGAYASRGSAVWRSLKGLSGGVMPPLLCPLLLCLPELSSAGLRRLADHQFDSEIASGRSVPATFEMWSHRGVASTFARIVTANVIARPPDAIFAHSMSGVRSAFVLFTCRTAQKAFKREARVLLDAALK